MTTGMSGCCSLTVSSSCRPSSWLPWSQMSRNTRFGRRDLISFTAPSLSRAVRVPWPSSCRRPATSSQMSASSSTIRISDAISQCSLFLLLDDDLRFDFFDLCLSLLRRSHAGRARAGRRTLVDEVQPHPGAALAGKFLGSVAQLDAAAVFLENAADDGEAKARALLAGGDIGLEQPVAIFLRQADAVVDHVDEDVVALTHRGHANAATAALGLRNRGDGLGRVLDDVGEPLRDQSAVEPRQHRILGHFKVD